MERHYYVYILASRMYGTLYVGITNNLIRRIWEHKNDVVAGFSKDYRVHRLVWFEAHETPIGAITREKQIKKWNRDWKVNLIQAQNPEWNDLYESIVQ
jgi:putative endonuclease